VNEARLPDHRHISHRSSQLQRSTCQCQGVLYPRTIAPGAQCDWSAVQWSGDPSIAETWQTHVADAGRETATWLQGTFELVHLHVTTVTDGGDTFDSDEVLAHRLN
jgi:hypothetical protein